MFENKFRRALEDGGVPVLGFVFSGSTYVTRVVAGLGFDSLLFDMQHEVGDFEHLFDLVTLAGPDLSPMVRVPSSEIENLERAVEARVHGVVCPSVDTAEETARVVAACRASRFGDVMAIVQIESVEGFENLERIVATPGLDAVLPGPNDLSIAFGGSPGLDYVGEASVGRLRKIIDAAHDHAVKVTLPAIDRTHVETILSWGVDWVSLVGDRFWITSGARSALADAMGAIESHSLEMGTAGETG